MQSLCCSASNFVAAADSRMAVAWRAISSCNGGKQAACFLVQPAAA